MAERPRAEPRPAEAATGARERIRGAIMDVALERGWEETTLEEVLDRAGVGIADFECHFADLEDCYMQVYLENGADFDRAVFSAFGGAPSWREGMRAGAYAAARYIRDNPREIRFSVLQRFNVDDITQVHRERQLREIIDRIDLGRQELDEPDSMTRLVAEGIMGSVYELMIGEFQRGNGGRAEDFVPGLMYVAVRPYLGHEVALEELEIPRPSESPEGGD
jgi:AcrR family transcriptional regulator